MKYKSYRQVSFEFILWFYTTPTRQSQSIEKAFQKASLQLASHDMASFRKLIFYFLRYANLLPGFYKAQVKKKSPLEAEIILQIGIVQLLFFEAIPHQVLVHETVEICELIKKPFLKGFVNAVLRKLLQNSLPELFLKKLKSMQGLSFENTLIELGFGEDYLEMLKSHSKHFFDGLDSPAESALWLNQRPGVAVLALKAELMPQEFFSQQKGEVQAKDWAELHQQSFIGQIFKKEALCFKWTWSQEKNSYFLLETENLENREGLFENEFMVQDFSSQFLCFWAYRLIQEKMRKPFIFVDVCAAPGGKTLSTLQFLHEQNCLPQKVILRDKTRRLEKLKKTVLQWQKHLDFVQNIQFEFQDSLTPLQKSESPCFYFVDAPCSGSGIVAKYPWIKYISHAYVQELQLLQKDIMSQIQQVLKPGDVCLYSVCSLFFDEIRPALSVFNESSDYTFLKPALSMNPAGQEFLSQHTLSKKSENISFSLIKAGSSTHAYQMAAFERIL